MTCRPKLLSTTESIFDIISSLDRRVTSEYKEKEGGHVTHVWIIIERILVIFEGPNHWSQGKKIMWSILIKKKLFESFLTMGSVWKIRYYCLWKINLEEVYRIINTLKNVVIFSANWRMTSYPRMGFIESKNKQLPAL